MKQLKAHTNVGIFWSVNGVIISDAVPQKEAEPYGDALQHGGHYEFWEGLAPETVHEYKFKSHAYDFYPRGRLVLFLKRRTVRLYVDSCMDNDVIAAALGIFNNAGYQLEIEKDEHYKCAGCNQHYSE